MKVFLAILEDRHTDDDIRVFDNIELAKIQIERWKAEYPHVTNYEFESHNPEAMDDGRLLHAWQADESQEEGMMLSIQEKEVHVDA